MILVALGGSWSAGVEHAVVSMGLDMLLQVLRTLEVLAAQGAAVRLERDVNADMGGDVVALHHLGATSAPRTCQAEVVGAFATDMLFAQMLLFPRESLVFAISPTISWSSMTVVLVRRRAG